MTLTEFLTARLDEDEYDANAFVNGLGEADRWDAAEVGGAVHSRRSGHLIAQGDLHMIGRHIARHDPARVLADVKAKRSIVERHYVPRGDDLETDEDTPTPEWLIRTLASVYADHPDYDEAWRA